VAFGDENQSVERADLGRSMVDHQPPSVTENLEQERRTLELRLRAIDELLEQLKANPETQQIIDNLSKLGRGMF